MSQPTLDAPRGRALRRMRRLLVSLVLLAIAVIVIRYALNSFVGIDANLLWFRSVDHESVYTRIFWTEFLLFAIFGGLMAVAIAGNLLVLYRYRPKGFRPDPVRQRWRFNFKRVEPRLRRWLFAAFVLYFGVTMGARAAGSWQVWLQWRHSTSFGQKDPQFHRDVSYYLFIYPMHRLVLTLLFRIVATSLIVVLVSAYMYGGARLRGKGPRFTRAVRAQLCLIVGAYLILKAFAYWLDRLALVTSNRGLVTGPAYTDVHALLPGKFVLAIIAFVCALLVFADIYARNSRLLFVGLGLMAASAFVFGVAWPAIVQQFREKPAASTLELPYIARGITATRDAYGLSDTVTDVQYPNTPTLSGAELQAQADNNGQIRLLDPNQLSPTFNVKQQVQSIYGFKSTLDIDRYPIDGTNQDVAIAVRELTLSGLPSSRQTWTNTHLVYTHGYGVVAAPTGAFSGGLPEFVENGLPQQGSIPISQPRIYFGQMSPSYSIVGAPAGSKPREFDLPSSTASGQPTDYTYTGGGGIPVHALLNRFVEAYSQRSLSLLFSSEINKDSQLLTIRNPRSRVAAVAPWLTLDGDVYPTVVNGQILWVVDGYTTSNNYPDSQQINLRSATTSTLTVNGSSVTQPSTSINYLRNSVKATVNAYTGQVTLYAWNQGSNPDPVLRTWEKAFPGLVQPQSKIPAALVPHLRYPQDLFDVQRSLLTRYHVTNASAFYAGSNFWNIPIDPTLAATTRINSLGKKVKVSAPTIASTYMTMSPDGESSPVFALSTPMVTLNSRNLSAELTVNSQPGPGYGHMTLLELPTTGLSAAAPAQIQNDIESDPNVSQKLTLLRGGNSKVVLGNLLTIPLGGQMLYVEPIYTQSRAGATFPILQRVVAIYGNGRPAFTRTLSSALTQVLHVPVT